MSHAFCGKMRRADVARRQPRTRIKAIKIRGVTGAKLKIARKSKFAPNTTSMAHEEALQTIESEVLGEGKFRARWELGSLLEKHSP